MANVQMFMNPEQIRRALKLCWKATNLAKQMGLKLRVPVCIVGDTGCGKTEIVTDFYEEMRKKMENRKDKKNVVDLKLNIMILSMVPQEDIGGIPTVKDGKIVHSMMKCLPFDSEEWAINFLDEFDRASPETQNAALQLLLGGSFHGHILSPNSYSICAMNGTADIYTNPLSQAARTRMCTLFMSSKSRGYVDSYNKWSRKKGLPEVCRVLKESHPDLIQSTQEFEELAVCTDRSKDMAGLVSLARQEIDRTGAYETEDIYRPVIAGLIGMTAMATWVGIEEAMQKGIDVEEILRDPLEADLVEDSSMTIYTLNAVMGIIQTKYEGDLKMVRAAGLYALRYDQDEWIEIWMSSLLSKFPEFVKSSEYKKWLSKKQRTGKGVM